MLQWQIETKKWSSSAIVATSEDIHSWDQLHLKREPPHRLHQPESAYPEQQTGQSRAGHLKSKETPSIHHVPHAESTAYLTWVWSSNKALRATVWCHCCSSSVRTDLCWWWTRCLWLWRISRNLQQLSLGWNTHHSCTSWPKTWKPACRVKSKEENLMSKNSKVTIKTNNKHLLWIPNHWGTNFHHFPLFKHVHDARVSCGSLHHSPETR